MKPFLKRMLIAIGLGVVAGLFCAWGAAQNGVPNAFNFAHPMFWATFSNRVVLGFIVGIAGFATHHPLFGFRCYPWLRGAFFGAVISLLMAIGVLLSPTEENPWNVFWLIIGFGVFFGVVIDLLATKFAGEGKKLYE